jgi:hypothetical protein
MCKVQIHEKMSFIQFLLLNHEMKNLWFKSYKLFWRGYTIASSVTIKTTKIDQGVVTCITLSPTMMFKTS